MNQVSLARLTVIAALVGATLDALLAEPLERDSGPRCARRSSGSGDGCRADHYHEDDGVRHPPGGRFRLGPMETGPGDGNFSREPRRPEAYTRTPARGPKVVHHAPHRRRRPAPDSVGTPGTPAPKRARPSRQVRGQVRGPAGASSTASSTASSGQFERRWADRPDLVHLTRFGPSGPPATNRSDLIPFPVQVVCKRPISARNPVEDYLDPPQRHGNTH